MNEELGKKQEKYLLDANEHMLRAKGYVLCTLQHNGQLNYIMDVADLNPAEVKGLVKFMEETECDVNNTVDMQREEEVEEEGDFES